MARKLDSFVLTYKDYRDHDNDVTIDHVPDKCPSCNNGIDAKYIGAYGRTLEYGNGHDVQAIFKCTIEKCQAIFVAFYTSPVGSHRFDDGYVFLRNTYIPSYFEEIKFEEEITKLSPNFVKIYTEAFHAEEMGLREICGAGYRKALEFLVKDYLKAINPTIEPELKKHMLGYVIVHYVKKEKIVKMAGLAKEVGNDETHYNKKLEELSLEDMKKLIRLTQNWIVDDLLTEEYAGIYDQIMSKKGKS